MEPSSVLALSSVAGSVGKSMGGILSNWIYHKYKKWRLKKRLTGVLLLKGVSTLCQKLSNSEVLLFDIDTIYRELEQHLKKQAITRSLQWLRTLPPTLSCEIMSLI